MATIIKPTEITLVSGKENSNEYRDGVNGKFFKLVQSLVYELEITSIKIQTCNVLKPNRHHVTRFWVNAPSCERKHLIAEFSFSPITPSNTSIGGSTILLPSQYGQLVLKPLQCLYVSCSILDDEANQFEIIVNSQEINV